MASGIKIGQELGSDFQLEVWESESGVGFKVRSLNPELSISIILLPKDAKSVADYINGVCENATK